MVQNLLIPTIELSTKLKDIVTYAQKAMQLFQTLIFLNKMIIEQADLERDHSQMMCC